MLPPSSSAASLGPTSQSTTTAQSILQSEDSFHSAASHASSSFLRAGPQVAGTNGAGPPQQGSLSGLGIEVDNAAEMMENLLKQLSIQTSVQDGAENMLQVLEMSSESSEDSKELLRKVELELSSAKKNIVILRRQIDDLKDHPDIPRALRKKLGQPGSPTLSTSVLPLAPPSLSARRLPSSSSIATTTKQRPSSPEEDFQTSLRASRSLIVDMEKSSTSERERIEEASRLVELLLKNVRVRYELSARDELRGLCFSMLAESESKDVRAAAYRILRHQLVEADGWRRLEDAGLHYYIIRTFTRDARHNSEKVQCLKLIRAAIDLALTSPSTSTAPGTHSGGPGGRVPLSDAVVRTLVSVAENGDDPFRSICLQTLAEISIIDVNLLLRSNAVRVLLQCFTEGPHELASVIAPVLLQVIDSPASREGLRAGMDVEMALSGFTDIVGSGDAYLSRLRATSKVVSLMLKSWSGIIYLCMDGRQGITSLVNSLRIPTIQMREVLLDLFFEIFRIKTPSWYLAFLDGKRLTMYSKNVRGHQALSADTTTTKSDPDKVTLVDHYTSFLLAVFLESGLIDALVDVIEEAHNILSRKATLLVGEVLALANKLLPSSFAARVQALPRLFGDVAKSANPFERSTASSALSAIDSLHRNRSRLQGGQTEVQQGRKRSNSVQDSLARGQRQVESVKVRMGMQMEDKHFQSLLNETQVLITRDHNKWNFDILMAVVCGPLLHPRRLEEALKASKFGRRLLSFFHPQNRRFSDIKKTKPNLRWVRLGCSLITTLVANPDGVAFLAADKLLPQLYDCFAQLDYYSGTVNSDPLLSKKRLDDTLTSGYMDIIGTLSQNSEGLALLERFKFFTVFYHLSDLKSREDLIRAIIEKLDYSTDGHPRIVLSKALTSSYMHIRLYATQHLGQLVLSTPEANAWTLRLLITQLYDPSPEVCEMAVHFLEEACEALDALEIVVGMRPFLDHLGEIGHPLLLRFLSTSVGFAYLCQVEYIDREMDYWFHDRNHSYVVQVEVYLSKALSPTSEDDADDLLIFDGTVPPHFYGELTKTEEGCHLLREKGHFVEFSQFIRQHGLEASDSDLLNKLKSVLWAVGNIGSTSGGFPFLEDEDILTDIVGIAERSPVLSIRGTCFYVLGLISLTRAGADTLIEYDWEATLDAAGKPTGLCIPVDIAKFTHIAMWEQPYWLARPASLDLVPPTSAIERSVLVALGNLSNHVQANVSFRTLAKLKRHHRQLFSSPQLFYRALHALSSAHHRLPIRRFVFDLFDVKLSPTTIDELTRSAAALRSTSTATNTTVDANATDATAVSAPGISATTEAALAEFASADGSQRAGPVSNGRPGDPGSGKPRWSRQRSGGAATGGDSSDDEAGGDQRPVENGPSDAEEEAVEVPSMRLEAARKVIGFNVPSSGGGAGASKLAGEVALAAQG